MAVLSGNRPCLRFVNRSSLRSRRKNEKDKQNKTLVLMGSAKHRDESCLILFSCVEVKFASYSIEILYFVRV